MQTLTERLLDTAPHECFTAEDLTYYLAGSDDARYGLVKRALAAREVIRLRRGLYCLAPQYRRHPVNLFALAQHVYGPSYVSLESALSYHGWIPEAVYAVTCAAFGESKEFATPLGTFRYTRVPQTLFYGAVERLTGEGLGDVALVARPIKALADYVYAYRKDWRSIAPVINSLRVDEEDLFAVSRAELEELIGSYRSRRVRRFLESIGLELGL